MNKSESTNELFAALAKAQADIKSARKSGFNPHFKSFYSTLMDVWDACRSPLSKNGLCIIQTLEQVDNKPIIRTILGHSSGQFISSECPIISARQDMQGLGSAVSYAKRYSLSAMVGVDSDEDDDGEGAAGRGDNDGAKKTENAPPSTPPQSEKKPKSISEAQLTRLHAIAGKAKWNEAQIKAFLSKCYNITSTKDIPWTIYNDVCKTIENKQFTEVMNGAAS